MTSYKPEPICMANISKPSINMYSFLKRIVRVLFVCFYCFGLILASTDASHSRSRVGKLLRALTGSPPEVLGKSGKAKTPLQQVRLPSGWGPWQMWRSPRGLSQRHPFKNESWWRATRLLSALRQSLSVRCWIMAGSTSPKFMHAGFTSAESLASLEALELSSRCELRLMRGYLQNILLEGIGG